jgi:hypothetical protein
MASPQKLGHICHFQHTSRKFHKGHVYFCVQQSHFVKGNTISWCYIPCSIGSMRMGGKKKGWWLHLQKSISFGFFKSYDDEGSNKFMNSNFFPYIFGFIYWSLFCAILHNSMWFFIFKMMSTSQKNQFWPSKCSSLKLYQIFFKKSLFLKFSWFCTRHIEKFQNS